MDRRNFIRDTCTFCIGTALSGIMLSSCNTQNSIYKSNAEEGILKVPESAFEGKKYLIVRPDIGENDIFIHNPSEGVYNAVLMKCSHRDASLMYTSGGLVCNEHGSRFNFEGDVLKEPATKPLVKYQVTKNNSFLFIKLKS